ncbi:hypothetical protein FACS1894218_0510 [Bacilli bacterium]|nr:hypothetical protein FACS1894218_0510 [Bacilli bacterium]
MVSSVYLPITNGLTLVVVPLNRFNANIIGKCMSAFEAKTYFTLFLNSTIACTKDCGWYSGVIFLVRKYQ